MPSNAPVVKRHTQGGQLQSVQKLIFNFVFDHTHA